MSQNKSYIDEKVAEFEKRIACNKHEGFSGPITCDSCVLGSGELFFVREALHEAYSKGRDDERHDDSPMGEGLFEGRKLKELSRPELYRAIGRFDGLYRSALQSHE